MGKKARLVFITASYPFGKGEKPFIEPELKPLCESFDVTILTLATKEHIKHTEYTSARQHTTRYSSFSQQTQALRRRTKHVLTPHGMEGTPQS